MLLPDESRFRTIVNQWDVACWYWITSTSYDPALKVGIFGGASIVASCCHPDLAVATSPFTFLYKSCLSTEKFTFLCTTKLVFGILDKDD